tara:strand:- start:874 stop:1056 length:183 start_codon:yes stop_codon:yes gene_type:complete
MIGNNKEYEYYKSLSDIEKSALKIAKVKLGSSFIPEKTIGYMKYIKELNEKKNNIDKTDN